MKTKKMKNKKGKAKKVGGGNKWKNNKGKTKYWEYQIRGKQLRKELTYDPLTCFLTFPQQCSWSGMIES